MDPQFDSWRRALAGERIPIKEGEPLSGFWRVWTGKTPAGAPIYKPLGIWRDGVDLVVQYDGAEIDPAAEKLRVAKLWLSGSSKPCSAKDYDFALANGCWPAEAAGPKTPATAETQFDLVEVIDDTTAVAAIAGPPPAGHNSGAAPDALAQMRADLAADAEACAEHYTTHPIASKADADAAENTRKRLMDAAKAADAKRREIKKPHEDAAAAVDAAWFPPIRRAQEVAKAIDGKAQTWVRAENARLAAEAAEAARVAREQQEREAAAREAERQRLLKTAPVEALKIPPLAPLPPAEPVAAPKVMIGTNGARRGERKGPATAEITDPLALASYLIGIQHTDLLECLQRIANTSARAKVPLVGCRMSWEAETGAT